MVSGNEFRRLACFLEDCLNVLSFPFFIKWIKPTTKWILLIMNWVIEYYLHAHVIYYLFGYVLQVACSQECFMIWVMSSSSLSKDMSENNYYYRFQAKIYNPDHSLEIDEWGTNIGTCGNFFYLIFMHVREMTFSYFHFKYSANLSKAPSKEENPWVKVG